MAASVVTGAATLQSTQPWQPEWPQHSVLIAISVLSSRAAPHSALYNNQAKMPPRHGPLWSRLTDSEDAVYPGGFTSCEHLQRECNPYRTGK